MKLNKKKILTVAILVIIIVVAVSITILVLNNKQNPEETLKQYISYIEQKNYEEMYNSITDSSKANISQEDFIKRNKNIYEGIEANNIKLEIKQVEKEKNNAKITYSIEMNTLAGNINFDNVAEFTKEDKNYKLQWTSKDIFPNLSNDDKVRVKTSKAQRGKILDRNRVMLAGAGTASSIGLVPGKMNENADEDIEKISELLDVSVENINKMLSASYVKDDTFVPIKTVAKTEQELKNKLLEIKGIKIIDTRNKDISL